MTLKLSTLPLFPLLAALVLAAPNLSTAEDVKPPAAATPSAETKPVAPPAPEQKKAEPAGKEQGVKIGYVELSRFAGESATGKAIRARLQAKSDSYRSQMTAKQKQLEKQKDAIQEKLAGMTPKQREAKAKEFEKKIDEYQKFAKKADRELIGLEEELSTKLLKEVDTAAGAYGKANGYAAIVVKKELLYVRDSVETSDVTEEVLKLMPKDAEKK